ncbi:MAG: nitroreductase family protein [Oscillospiraceae bacterium]|nr:nitroreductase family protein [Oscillospiraceae bacterium]
MNRTEAIRHRRSVRTFDGRELRQEEKEKILDFAKKVQNPYDLAITWEILDAKKNSLSSPVITGTDTWIAGKMARVPHAEEAFGYTFEKVVLFAESLGIGTTWIAGTMDREAFEHAMRLKDTEVLPCVSPIGYPAGKMSVRESLMRKGINADGRKAFGELFFKDTFDAPLSPMSSGKVAEALEMVRLAPSAVNRQTWRIVVCDDCAHLYVKRSKGYVSSDKWDIQKIDMGIALCHFEIGAEESGLSVSFELQDPGIEVPNDLEYIATLRF